MTSLCQDNLENLHCFVDAGGVAAIVELLHDTTERVAQTAAITVGFLCMQDSAVRPLVCAFLLLF